MLRIQRPGKLFFCSLIAAVLTGCIPPTVEELLRGPFTIIPNQAIRDSLSVEPGSIRFRAIGETQQLQVLARLRNGQTKEISAAFEGTTYAVLPADSTVFRVDRDGLVTAVAPGRAELEVRNGDLRQVLPVSVTIRAGIEVLPKDVRLPAIGDTQPLRVEAIDTDGVRADLTSPANGTTYESRNPLVATVSADGVVTAVANGQTTVAARNGGSEDSASVTVGVATSQPADEVVSISISPLSLRLVDTFSSQQLTVTGVRADGSSVDLTRDGSTRFESTAPGVARVSRQGRVFGVADGAAMLIVRYNALQAAVPVDVEVPTTIVQSSPFSGESGVTITRETIIDFLNPVLEVPPDAIRVLAGSTPMAGRVEVSGNRKRIWRFYGQELPGSTQITIRINGDAIIDHKGQAVDADGDGRPGGVFELQFSTVNLTSVPGTHVCGRIFDSDLGPNGEEIPLQGVTVSVDGRPDLIAVTDKTGNFELRDTPVGEFFVHLDGSTEVLSQGLDGPLPYYYPTLGKPFAAPVAGQLNVMPMDIYLPKIPKAGLQMDIDTNREIRVGSADPRLAGVQVTVPAGSLFREDGNPVTFVGLGAVNPDRLPGPLPPGVAPPVVFSFQTDATNLRSPAAVRFPRNPPALAQDRSALMSFNHDSGRFEYAGDMVPSPDGSSANSQNDAGIPAPGWHFVGPRPIRPPTPPCHRTCCFCQADSTFNRILPATLDGTCNPRNRVCLLGQQCPPPCNLTCALECEDEAVSGARFRLNVIRCIAQRVGCALNVFKLLRIRPTMPKSNCSELFSGQWCVDKVRCEMGNDCWKTYCPQYRSGSCFSGGRGSVDDDIDPILMEVYELAEQIYQRLATIREGAEVPRDVRAEVESLALAADSRAGGDVEVYLDALIRAAESGVVSAEEEVSPSGSLPVSSVHFAAFVELADGTVQVIRALARPFGQYEVFPPAPGRVQGVSFYDINRREHGFVTPEAVEAGLAFPPVYMHLVGTGYEDSDQDGLADVAERVLGTNPNNPDSDGDSIPDGVEVQQQSDPLSGSAALTGLIAAVDTPGFAHDICVRDNLAIVSDGDAGVSIFNIFQTMSPRLIARVDTPGLAVDADCDEDYAAVADGPAGLAIVDLRDPPTARVVHQIALPGGATARCVTTVLGVAYVGDDRGRIHLYELSSGLSLGFTALPVSNTSVDDLGVSGSTLFAVSTANASTTGTLWALRLNQGTPTILSQAPCNTSGLRSGPFPRRRLFAGVDRVTVSGFDIQRTFDVTNPAAMSQTCSLQQAGGNGTSRGACEDGSGNRVLIVGAQDNGECYLYDSREASDCSRFSTLYQTPGNAHGVAMHNALAYLADGDRGLQVVNLRSVDVLGVPPTVTLDDRDATGELEEQSTAAVRAVVVDDVQPRHVEFYVDDELAYVDASYPFEIRFTVPRIADQPSVTVRARAFDTGGNSAWSEPRVFAILPDVTPPGIAGYSPRVQDMSSPDSVRNAVVRFTESVDPASIDLRVFSPGADNVLGTADDTEVSNATLNYFDSSRTATLEFADSLSANVYQARLFAGLRDLAGNAREEFSWVFSTRVEQIRITSGRTLTCDDQSLGEWDVIVDGTTLTTACAHNFNSLSVINGGSVTHATADQGGVDIRPRYWCLIEGGASITGNGRGFAAVTGPGAGVTNGGCGTAGGGGFGGRGGNGNTSGGNCYGLIEAPSELGSGGGNPGCCGGGGRGGGRVRVETSGLVVVNGIVSANGAQGSGGGPPCAVWGGGGSGGGIYIQAGRIFGSGQIAALGGAGGGLAGGGGGGGRIALTATHYSFVGDVTASGGPGGQFGGAGTIYVRQSSALAEIALRNDDHLGASTDLRGEVVLDANVSIGDGAIVVWRSETAESVNITGNLTIGSSGRISVDRLGYPAATGPGAGGTRTFCGRAGGGGHGGTGGDGDADEARGGAAYADALAPVELGSGGGNPACCGAGGRGGGRLRLIVAGTLQNDGEITARGESGSGGGPPCAVWGGGGAGGSIWITALRVVGSGSYDASGGAGGGGAGGGGGGGRVSIVSPDIRISAERIIVAGGAGDGAGNSGSRSLTGP